MNVFERDALQRAVTAASPDVIIHQLTDLAAGIDPNSPEEGSARNARLRREGTANLVAAARAAGAKRLIAQSIAWAYGLVIANPPYGRMSIEEVRGKWLKQATEMVGCMREVHPEAGILVLADNPWTYQASRFQLLGTKQPGRKGKVIPAPGHVVYSPAPGIIKDSGRQEHAVEGAVRIDADGFLATLTATSSGSADWRTGCPGWATLLVRRPRGG